MIIDAKQWFEFEEDIMMCETGEKPRENTYSSPLRNSAVKAKCSREREEERSPPRNSASRTVPNAERFPVLYRPHPSQFTVLLNKTLVVRTLNAKFERTWARPGLVSYRLPAFRRTVTVEVGWPLSREATLTPPAASTTVAKERLEDLLARRAALSIEDR